MCMSWPLYAKPLTPLFFFFNDTATTEIYTLSLHDALPISDAELQVGRVDFAKMPGAGMSEVELLRRYLDRKSTRLNSSHGYISYAVFCLKKKKSESCTFRVEPHGQVDAPNGQRHDLDLVVH